MRLGGPLLRTYSEPEQWAQALNSLGYRACFFPPTTGSATVADFAAAAAAADIVIAEVGIWNNPISVDRHQRLAAVLDCQAKLALADEVGKDIYLQPRLTTHLYEVRPGMGMLNYPTLLRTLSPLGKDLPLMLEHLNMDEDYYLAAEFIRRTARENNVSIR